jgi:prevent-host-death family protein
MVMEDRQVHSDEARRNLRELLNAVEHDGEHVTILRYDTPAAVMVPVEWYETVKAHLPAGGAGRVREGGPARRALRGLLGVTSP